MATENVLINFEVNYEQLTSAQQELAKTGKIDTKGFDAIQSAIDTTATDSKGLIKTFKDVAQASVKMGKTVEVAFGAGVQDALDEAGVSAEEFATALKKANAPSVSLKKELLALKEAMARMKAEGKDTGKEFDTLRQRAGKLSDAIADANAEIKNAGSDTRGLDNVVGSISALAGGYAAVQGAAALFGEENEDVQKALLKVNAAMALAQGLQVVYNATLKEGALTKLADSVATGAQTAATTLLTFVTTGATAAARLYRAALIATGIGAVVILVLALVDAFSKHNAEVFDATKKIDELNDAYGSLTNTINQYNNEAASIASAAGAKESEVLKIRLEGTQKLIAANRKLENEKRDAATESQKNGKITQDIEQEIIKTFQEGLKLKSEERVLEAQITAAVKKEAKERADALKEANEKLQKKNEEAAKKATAAELAELDKRVKAQLAALDKEEEQTRIHFENEQELLERARQEAADINAKWDKLRLDQMDFLARSSQVAADKAKADRDAENARIEERRTRIISIAREIGGVFAELSRQQADRDAAFITGKRREIDELARAGALTVKQAEARQKQLDDLERRQKNKAAQRDKQFAVFQALLAVPQAYLTGLKTSLPLAIIMGALAAVQAALVISRPVPKFFRGKKDSYEGPGIVGDMGTELVEQNGRMFLYTKPTQTYLGANDKVYTAAETRQIMHNTNISTTVKQQPANLGIDYERLGKAIPVSHTSINIDEHGLVVRLANEISSTNYRDRRYSSK